MNKDYLYSILNLYVNRENETNKIILGIKRNTDDIEFNFTMNQKDEEKTSFVIPFDVYKENIINFINLYKEDLMIIDEKYEYNEVGKTCYYYVLFNNGRTLSFDGFTIIDMNNIRNILYNININQEEVRVDDINVKKQMAYKPRLSLQQAGFSSYASLFMIVLFFADILVIALWIFKLIFK